jgi:hypothetical protein
MISEAQRVDRIPAETEYPQERPRAVRPAVHLRPVPDVQEMAPVPEPVAFRPLDAFRPREPGRITVQIANTPELMETVYRLRHDSYVAQGFLEPRASGLFSDDWDECPHFFSMLGFVDGKPAVSVRISHCTPAAPARERTETTAMELFADDVFNLAERFATGQTPAVVMEMSRLTRHPDFADSNSDALFGIFRANFYCLRQTNADMLISAVRAHHMPIYRRMGFQKMTDPRPYPKLKFETALMACFRQSYDAIQKTIPIFQGIDETDGVYGRLFAGERVRIFDEMPERGVGR